VVSVFVRGGSTSAMGCIADLAPTRCEFRVGPENGHCDCDDLTPRLKAWPGATTILGTVRFAAFNTSKITSIIAMD
jgi:hypothetical protein